MRDDLLLDETKCSLFLFQRFTCFRCSHQSNATPGGTKRYSLTVLFQLENIFPMLSSISALKKELFFLPSDSLQITSQLIDIEYRKITDSSENFACFWWNVLFKKFEFLLKNIRKILYAFNKIESIVKSIVSMIGHFFELRWSIHFKRNFFCSNLRINGPSLEDVSIQKQNVLLFQWKWNIFFPPSISYIQ